MPVLFCARRRPRTFLFESRLSSPNRPDRLEVVVLVQEEGAAKSGPACDTGGSGVYRPVHFKAPLIKDAHHGALFRQAELVLVYRRSTIIVCRPNPLNTYFYIHTSSLFASSPRKHHSLFHHVRYIARGVCCRGREALPKNSTINIIHTYVYPPRRVLWVGVAAGRGLNIW